MFWAQWTIRRIPDIYPVNNSITGVLNANYIYVCWISTATDLADFDPIHPQCPVIPLQTHAHIILKFHVSTSFHSCRRIELNCIAEFFLRIARRT